MSDDTPTTPQAPEEWRMSSSGYQYVPARGRSGMVKRQGEETVEQAYERDGKEGPKDRRPRKKAGATPRKPPAPTQTDLKQIEFALSEALSSPALLIATTGDEWAATHFTTQGPILARNLCAVAEHNPWLRAKLEEMASGESLMTNIMLTMVLAKAVIAYVVPPAIYYINPSFVKPAARQMFGVPDHGPPVPTDDQLEELRNAAAAEAAAAAQAA